MKIEFFFQIALPAVLLAVATRGLPMPNPNKEMPTFKHFFLDAEPQPGKEVFKSVYYIVYNVYVRNMRRHISSANYSA